MASPYTTKTAIGNLLGVEVRDMLADFDEDGAADAGIVDDAITRGDRKIDAMLGRRYVVPFDSLPDTPGLVQTASAHLAAVELFAQSHSDGIDLDYHRREARELLEGILSGKYALPGATLLPADERVGLFLVDAAAPVFGGIDPDTGDSNMGAW